MLQLAPSTQQIDFQGRRALVTGAGKGIGREIAVMLHRFNAKVIAVSRTQTDLDALRDDIGCQTILGDLGNVAEARQVAHEAGNVDLLVNNAAIAILEPFLETKVESWDATMAINLRAVVVVSQIIAKGMIERGVQGSIVNSINPTVVMTDMGKRAWSDPAKGGPMLARIPLRRFAECEDIASVVCFVLSDAAGMLNGLALRVDGGFWAT